MSRSGPSAAAARLAPVSWRTIALPAEHGGWGLLAEPVVLGLFLAPSAAGAALALAACGGFLARHPLRLVLLDRRKGSRYPRTALAERFCGGYAASAAALVALAFALARTPFWAALLVAVPIGLVALAHDALGRGREALPEVAGAVALGASATAIALAGGVTPAVAWGAWGLLALRAATSVLYVRARIRLDRGLAAGPGTVLAGHALALLAALGLAGTGWGPWLAAAAFLVLLARAGWGLSPRRRRVRPQVLGFQELAYGALTLVLLVAGYRFAP